jgi:hypothetical protein
MLRASANSSPAAIAVADRAQATAFRAAVRGAWRSLTGYLTDPYRPELHYMRGPGPKWRAKHSQTPEPQDQSAGTLPLAWAPCRRTSS